MNNDVNTISGERLSFYKLFSEKQYKISIPIIQRDYAQGRQSTTEVRNIFLDALYKYLEENIPNRDLDFVYGTLSEVDGIKNFIPLDGQQRLTTLFLLHWYLWQISDKTDKKKEFKNCLLKDKKSMFTYETRTSSSDFCDVLMGNDIVFTKLKDDSVSKTIEDASWFFLSWKDDPTIQSMLTMLDAIHGRFAKKKEYFERLIDTEKPIITFLFMNLKDFNLTDDLYIKMNSRGKQLTPFENFKARLEQDLRQKKVVTKRKFSLAYDGKEKEEEAALKDYFSHNIDTKWADLFWNYRELAGDKNTYDDELVNLIRVIFASQYAISGKNDENFEFLLGTQAAKEREDYPDPDIISYYKYQELKAITESSILYLVDAFDNLVNGNDRIKNHITKTYRFYYDENVVFENALQLNDSFTYEQRILFHAYIRFLIKNKDDRTGLGQWMRVIHNLAKNTAIDGADDICSAIKSIEKLMPNSNNILKYLCKTSKIEFFSSWQVQEEIIKAHLINKSDKWKEKIEYVEKNGGFEGQIGFVLVFSGIVDYYDKNRNCDWTERENEKFYNDFENYADKAVAVFGNKDSYDDEYVWERAVLTKGDYLIDAYPRKNLLSSKYRPRDYSWKRLLRIKNEKGEENITLKRQLVKKVFDDPLFDKDKLQDSLKKICRNKTNTWWDYLIDCPGLIKYCQKGFIRFVDEHDIILLGQSQMNHLHSEMYTLFLWYKFYKNKTDLLKPFQADYYHSKSSEDPPCILLNDFCHNKKHYEISIYYCNDDELPNPYEIVFRKPKGANVPAEYGDDIKNILEKLSFSWNVENAGYFFTSIDSDTLMKKLGKLIEEIRKL